MLEFLLKYKINRLCNKSKRQKVFRSMEDLHAVLVVFDIQDYEKAEDFIRKLRQMKKKVKAYAYKTKDDTQVYSSNLFSVIDAKKDQDWMGCLTSTLMNELKSDTYDVLIDLTVVEIKPLEYLVASLNIPFKVGMKKNEVQLYDLSMTGLSKPEAEKTVSVSALGEQIMHYLDTIHSKK